MEMDFIQLLRNVPRTLTVDQMKFVILTPIVQPFVIQDWGWDVLQDFNV